MESILLDRQPRRATHYILMDFTAYIQRALRQSALTLKLICVYFLRIC